MKPIYFNVFAKFIGSSVYPIVRCDREGFKIGCYSETPALLTQDEIGPAITAAYSIREVTETTVKPDPQAESQRQAFTSQQQAESYLALKRRPVSISELAQMTGKSEEYLRAFYRNRLRASSLSARSRPSCCGD